MLRLTPAQYRTMPWKNGGGSTTELVIRPEGASVSDPFLVRVSIADVATSGPFSRFPGCDRHLVVLEGAGMVLDVAGRALPLEPFRPVFFSGDDAAEGRLVNGPVRDFNVIVDRARLTATLSVSWLAAALHLDAPAGTLNVVYVLDGGLEEAATGETLVLDQPHDVIPSGGPARLVLARLTPVSRLATGHPGR